MTGGVLMRMAGLEGVDLDELGDADRTEAIALLVATARGFSLAGGRWSSADWLAMSKLERAAASEAGEQLMRTSAVFTGNAARSEEAAAVVFSPVDGGEAYLDVIVSQKAGGQ